MAWQATGWAFKAPIENPGCKFVLVALGERGHSETGDAPWACWPSIESICEYTSQGYRTVQRHLEWLEANGYIDRERRTMSKGRKGSFTFTLNPFLLAIGQIGHRPEAASEVDEIGRTEPVKEPPSPKGAPKARGGAPPKPDAPPKSDPAPRGSRIPFGWTASAAEQEFAARYGFGPDEIRAMEDKFYEYWKAAGGKTAMKVDWSAAWRYWVQNTRQPRGGGNGPRFDHHGGQSTAAGRRHTERVEPMQSGVMAALERRNGQGRGGSSDQD